MSTLIDHARYFSINAHDGQVRKYTGEPYWHHCRNVARLVQERTNNDSMVAAAWLHDTLEDTDTTVICLESNFGDIVTRLVCDLTDIYITENWPELNRAERKNLECIRYKYNVSENAKIIKLCDLIDNTTSIVEHDPKFAITYLREKANLLEAMGFGR